jgi:chromatin remodeling complex protein RSC6
MSTPSSLYLVSRDLAMLLGCSRSLKRHELLSAILRYAMRHDLLSDNNQTLTPNESFGTLIGDMDAIRLKDLFLVLRAHVVAAPAQPAKVDAPAPAATRL